MENKSDQQDSALQGQEHSLTFGNISSSPFKVIADWMVIYEKEKPDADIFHTGYLSMSVKYWAGTTVL